MQIPKRKLGRYANIKPDFHLTKIKFNELNNKLEKLKFNQPYVAKEVRRLAEMGDFSENAAYQIAKGCLKGINQRILEIENYLNQAVIIKSIENTEAVQLGHRVTIEAAGKQKTYLILGSSETDPFKNIISHHSLIGSALMNRKVGDKIKIQTTNKEIEYKIIKIA